jgi:hypothetical protein
VCGYIDAPTTLGPTNRLLSSDWPGHLKRTVETMTGATCIFAQGATGNVGPGPEGFTDDVRVVRTLGLQIGCEAVRVHASMHLPPVQFRHERIWESGAPLGRWAAAPVTERAPVVRSRSHPLRLPLLSQPSLADVEAKRTEAQTKLQGLIARGAPRPTSGRHLGHRAEHGRPARAALLAPVRLAVPCTAADRPAVLHHQAVL